MKGFSLFLLGFVCKMESCQLPWWFSLGKDLPLHHFLYKVSFCFQRTSGWTVLCLLVKLRGKGWGIGWNQVEESWTIKNQIKSPNLDKTDSAKKDLYIKIQIDPNTMFIKTLFWPSHWMCGVTLIFFAKGSTKNLTGQNCKPTHASQTKFLAHLIIWAYIQSPHFMQRIHPWTWGLWIWLIFFCNFSDVSLNERCQNTGVVSKYF